MLVPLAGVDEAPAPADYDDRCKRGRGPGGGVCNNRPIIERNRKKQEDSFTGSLEINLGNPPKVPFQ